MAVPKNAPPAGAKKEEQPKTAATPAPAAQKQPHAPTPAPTGTTKKQQDDKLKLPNVTSPNNAGARQKRAQKVII